MEIQLQKENIVEGIQKAFSVIPTKAGAYLRSLWIQTETNTISIMATDASIEFQGKYKAVIEGSCLIGVSSKSFVELFRKLEPGDISLEIEAEKKMLLVKQHKAKYALPLSDNTWFQPFSTFPEENFVEWSGHALISIIDKISFCISDDETIEGINCISIKPAGNKIEVCGLNGHQLAVLKIENESLASILPADGILIHKKYLNEIKKLLSSGDIEVAIQEERFYIRNTAHTEQIAFPLSTYQYPEYIHFLERLNAPTVSKLQINKKLLLDSLNRILTFNTESNRCTYFSLDENSVLLSVQGYEIGTGEEQIDAEYSGSINKIAFPTKNIMEILSKYSSEKITFLFTSIEGPCGIIGDIDTEYTAIIMPMKITDN